MFRDPATGGELTYKLWDLKSKGATKILEVKGGWWQANDERLIFTFRKFDPTSTACKEELGKAWAQTKGDEAKQKGMLSFLSSPFYPRIDLFAKWARLIRDRNRDVVPV